MEKSNQDRKKRLAQLREDVKELQATLPEHCSGTKGYTGVHHATPAHWQKIEDIEEEIRALEAELAD